MQFLADVSNIVISLWFTGRIIMAEKNGYEKQ